MSERTGLGIVEIAILEAVETRGTDRVAGTRPRPALIRRLHRHLLLDRVGPLHHCGRNQLSAVRDGASGKHRMDDPDLLRSSLA